MLRRHRLEAVLALGCCLVLSPALTPAADAQTAAAKADNRPIPRLADGHVSFEAPPGEKGVWNRQDYRALLPEKPEEIALRDRSGNGNDGPPGLKRKVSEVPFQPWAKALWMYRQTHEFEPYTRCKPAGGFRNMATPYGTEFVQVPDQKRMYIFQTGGPHSFRPIYMDGRAHPKDLDPSYYGHSVGRWEGDTLVVDTVGFNERGWIDAYGTPTTKQLHLTERFTRLDFRTLRYEITIDDPGAYTAPFSTGMLMTFQSGREQFEYMCQDGNLASELMIGGENARVDRTSSIVP
ncbi:MAG TPA: hypothetical protein VM818_09130 [Vicinamibacterales bacterium]|nr:hypothetical protein [Vicinamibacterales bacterium]